eukprot:CFRG1778T1
MGKRKSKAKVTKKAKQKLDTIFTCLFCNHEKSVDVALDRDKDIGTISCRVCNESYQCVINALSEPVDVYSQWVDACDQINS